MSRPVLPRLPVAPLMRRAELLGRSHDEWAAAAGISRTALRQRIYIADGLCWETADSLAIALGFHPCEIWPEWWDVAKTYDQLFTDVQQLDIMRRSLSYHAKRAEDAGWREVERSWCQWAEQRERHEQDAANRSAEMCHSRGGM